MLFRGVALVACLLASASAFAGAEDPWEGGKWEPAVAWPFVPVSAATLPDGRILGWASNERLTFPSGPERTYTAVWDPYTGQFAEILHPTHDMFCGNQVMLEDGTVYVTGGRNQGNSPWTSMFDYRTNQWIQRENMNRGRWYPTSLALPNGKVFIAIGEGGTNTAELWNGQSQWSLLSGLNFDVPILNYTTYGERNWTPLMQLAPDGRIFHLGPTPKMHMIDTTGVGSITQVGPEITGWFPKDSATVVYDVGKILTAGGWIAGGNTVSSPRAMTIDINGASPQVADIANMNFARRFHNGVTLPTGEVVLVGGNTSGEKFSDVGTVYAVELWNPDTRAFRLGASMSVPRNYHSVALLMIDGRVWSGGGGLCGCSADHPDHQIWSPPYLFNTDGTLATRPQLHSAPGVVEAGSTITVRGSANLAKFSLVKMSSETHSNNTDMRFVPASFTETQPGEYAVNLHENINVLTPGFWMLFGVDSQGVPSVAKVMQVSTQGLSSGPPVLRDLGTMSHAKNVAYDTTLLVVEPDGDPLTFSATGLPPGLTLDSQSGRLFGTLTTSGNYAVSITVSDGVHGSDTTSFSWRVLDNPGVKYEYYQGSFDVLPNFDALTPVKSGVVSNFSLTPRTQEDFYAFRYRGRIDIATAGSYTFFTSSDDGSKLFIDGNLVVNNDGLHGVQERSGVVSLSTGLHTIEATFFEKTGGAALTVSYQGPGISKSPLPDSMLLQPAPPNAAPSLSNVADQAGIVGDQVNLGIAASDPNGDTLTFSATGLPAGLQIDPSTGTVSGTLTTAGFTTVTVTASDGSLSASDTFTWAVSAPNVAPTLGNIANQQGLVGDVVSLQVSASDANGDPIAYSATGLPPGLSIDTASGLIEGTLGASGTYGASVTASDGSLASSKAFTWVVNVPVVPIVIQPIVSPPQEAGVALSFAVTATGTPPLSYQWSYGDGSPLEAFSSSPGRSYTYAEAGRYVVTVTVRDGLGAESSYTFTQAVHAPHTALSPAQDSTIVFEDSTGTGRVWNVNPDANTVTVIDVATHAKIAEIAVGAKPSSLAFAGDGRIWVANKRTDTLSRIDPATRTVVSTVSLPRGSQPHGLVVDPSSGDVLVVLEATGQLVRIDDASGSVVDQTDVGVHARHLSVSGDGARVYVSRFVTPPLPGEDSAAPSLTRDGEPVGGEVLVLDGTTLTAIDTIVLPHGNAVISEHSAPGLPNYLRAPVIAPDGQSAWVPSKQDNLLRGMLRNGQPLDHDHTVRAITSRIDLATLSSDWANDRIDHDNASIASAAAFDASGSYLFVALEGNRMVAVVDAYQGGELFRFAAGRAPEGLVVVGRKVFVQNFMDRTVTVHDIGTLLDTGANAEARLATVSTVANETLPANVLLGKQHFYDALDGRLTKESYMSCASCHNDGGHDGRTWDFTGFGEGLRNTITLDGQGGTANGPVHWTGNFDEIQDFEGQIRNFVLGLGLMSDADFHAGTRSQSLGDPKAGLSADLDALAAYLASLNTVAKSPYREATGALTAAAAAGKAVFVASNCASCHAGNGFTDSALDVRHDVGTIRQPTSGGRMGGALDGFDTPTLRGLWLTAPYLHDGSAANLEAAVDAHADVSLSASDLSNVAAYLRQIDVDEGAAQSPSKKLESLMVTGVTSTAWTPVSLATQYTSLVAVCTIHQSVNTTPQVVRMRQTAADRFEIRLQRADTSTSALGGEKVYCLAAEEGTWKLSDGRRFEAKKYSSSRVDRKGSWVGELRTYGQTYTSPVVLGQIMSYNDTRWSVFWSRGTSSTSPASASVLYTGLSVGEDRTTTRASETIGYMVIEAGVGMANGIPYESKLGSDIVRGWDNSSTGYAYTFTRSYPGPRIAVVSQSAMDGGDGSFAYIRGASGLSSTTVRVVSDEDRMRDSERSHSAEQVAYFVIDQPAVLDLAPAP